MKIVDRDTEFAITEGLRRCDRVVVAWLFGSAASGRRRRDSDVDVAVIFAPGLSDGERFRLRCRLSELVASVARVDRADVVDFEAASPLLAHEIVRLGRLSMRSMRPMRR